MGPMQVAIALGILISECAHPAFQNRFLTFESYPSWHKLNAKDSLLKKVQSSRSAPWGGSTNFRAALDLILRACVDHKLPSEVVANMTLGIFSDMQFNAADN